MHPSLVTVGPVAGPPAYLQAPPQPASTDLLGTTGGPEPAPPPSGKEHPEIPKLLYINIHLQATSLLSAVTCNELSSLNQCVLYLQLQCQRAEEECSRALSTGFGCCSWR